MVVSVCCFLAYFSCKGRVRRVMAEGDVTESAAKDRCGEPRALQTENAVAQGGVMVREKFVVCRVFAFHS